MFGSKTVIVVNGAARAGKDTSITFMSTALELYGYSTSQFSSIDPVRNMLRAEGIAVDSKTPEIRAMLANIGDELRDFRVDVCARKAVEFTARRPNSVMFIHMREWPLIEKLRGRLWEQQGITLATVMVTNERITTEQGNAADKNVHDQTGDFEINNDGALWELAAACTLFVEKNWNRA